MTKKKIGISDRSPNLSAPITATKEIADEDSIFTNFKVKNFTLETNDNDNTVVILNILLDENKSIQKSIALLNRNIHELLVLLKDKKTKNRERRF